MEVDSRPERLARLKSIWHEDGQYEEGAGPDSWFDGSFVSPLVAIMLKRSVVTYDFQTGRENTNINIWDGRHNRAVCYLADGILKPPPGSICLKFEPLAATQGRPLGHYTYLRLKNDFVEETSPEIVALKEKIANIVYSVPVNSVPVNVSVDVVVVALPLVSLDSSIPHSRRQLRGRSPLQLTPVLPLLKTSFLVKVNIR